MVKRVVMINFIGSSTDEKSFLFEKMLAKHKIFI